MDDNPQNTAPNPVIPPIPDDFSNFSGGSPVAPTPTSAPSTPASSGNMSVKSTRRVSGKVVATVFGLLLLVGGVGAGLILVQQQQVLKQKAAGVGFCAGDSYICTDQNGNSTASATCSGLSQDFCNGDAVLSRNKAAEEAKFPGTTYTCKWTGAPCSWNTTETLTNGTGSVNTGGAPGVTCSGTQCTLTTNSVCNPSQITSYYCPGGLDSSAKCLEGRQNAGSISGGSSISLTNYTRGNNCGAIQLDFQGPGTAEDGCGAATYVIGAACGTSGGTGGGTTTVQPGCTLCSNQACKNSGQYNPANPTEADCLINSDGSCTKAGYCGVIENPNTPSKKLCGDACTQNSDCTPGSGGFPVTCFNGKCANPTCVIGGVDYTEPGAICSCKPGTPYLCGQKSSGPCPSGTMSVYTDSTCTNVNAAACVGFYLKFPDEWVPYIVGNNPDGTGIYQSMPTYNNDWKVQSCRTGDTHAQYVTNVKTGQTTGFTPDQLAQTCVLTPTAACSSVKAYDANWNLLTSTQLAALQAGATVNFSVLGTTSSGAFDKARFTINGAQQAETTSTKPGANQEFVFQYVIPTGVTSFTVSAQLHQAQLNQWF